MRKGSPGPQLSIIVCAFDEEARTRACLESLFAQDLDPSRYEIVFVDDGSRDATGAIALSTFAANEGPGTPSHRYVRIEHGGLCAARNTGIQRAEGEILAFIDADALAEPDWARRLLEFFECSKTVEVVGGRVRILNPESLTARLLDLWHYDESDRRSIIGCNMAFRRRVFDRIGGFRTCFQSRGDETELLMRQARPEHVRKLPQALVHHERPESFLGWLRERRANGRFYAWGERLTTGRRGWARLAKGIVSRCLTLSPLALWPLGLLHPAGWLASLPGIVWNVRRQRGGRTQWMFHALRREIGGIHAWLAGIGGVFANLLGDWNSDVGYLRGVLERPGPFGVTDETPPTVESEFHVRHRAKAPSLSAAEKVTT